MPSRNEPKPRPEEKCTEKNFLTLSASGSSNYTVRVTPVSAPDDAQTEASLASLFCKAFGVLGQELPPPELMRSIFKIYIQIYNDMLDSCQAVVYLNSDIEEYPFLYQELAKKFPPSHHALQDKLSAQIAELVKKSVQGKINISTLLNLCLQEVSREESAALERQLQKFKVTLNSASLADSIEYKNVSLFCEKTPYTSYHYLLTCLYKLIEAGKDQIQKKLALGPEKNITASVSSEMLAKLASDAHTGLSRLASLNTVFSSAASCDRGMEHQSSSQSSKNNSRSEMRLAKKSSNSFQQSQNSSCDTNELYSTLENNNPAYRYDATDAVVQKMPPADKKDTKKLAQKKKHSRPHKKS